MSHEPINIFSHKIDVAGVVQVLRDTGLEIQVTGPDDDWTEIEVVTKKKGLFRRAQTLVFGHNAEYYDGPDWPNQVLGMQGYFGRFPDTPAKPEAMRLIRSFRFALSLPKCDLDIDSDDDRLELLFTVCRHLDAAIFTPSSLRDASGRILFGAVDAEDPQAVFPRMPETADHPDAVDDDDDDDEDDYDPQPPTPERVARRTLALTAVAARATLELDASQDAVDEPEPIRKRMVAWVEDLEINDELEPQEWKVLQRPVGTLEQQDFINAMWRVEGLAVLAWALQLHPLPPYDELVFPAELYDAVGLFDVEAGKQLISSPNLRSEDELGGLLEHILAFHWRIRDFSLRPEAMDFVEFSKECWFGSFDITQFRTIDNDLALGEFAIADADPDEISKASSTAMERHMAINWLHGYSEIYSDTDTST